MVASVISSTDPVADLSRVKVQPSEIDVPDPIPASAKVAANGSVPRFIEDGEHVPAQVTAQEGTVERDTIAVAIATIKMPFIIIVPPSKFTLVPTNLRSQAGAIDRRQVKPPVLKGKA